MARRKNNKKKLNQGFVRPEMPVKKPNAKHMPICSAHGCNRRVSDARKSRCSKCGQTITGYNQYYDMYDWD